MHNIEGCLPLDSKHHADIDASIQSCWKNSNYMSVCSGCVANKLSEKRTATNTNGKGLNWDANIGRKSQK